VTRQLLTRNSRARWTVARWLNRLPGMCWAQLVGWAMGDDRLRDTTQAYTVGGVNCRTDAARCGTCYCGRIDPAGATKRTSSQDAVRGDAR
jgi:hypothetical protein